MRYGFMLMLLSVAFLPPLFSQEQELSGLVTEVQTKNPVPRLIPRHEGLVKLMNENMSSLQPTTLVETLYRYQKPSQSAGDAVQWNDAEQLEIFNRLVALSSLAGIQYYSESRKSMRIFYETSRVTGDNAGKIPLSDPDFTSLPKELTLYARQKDLTFGDNVYRYEYHTDTNAIFFIQENLTSMSAGIIPAIGKNKFKTVMAIIDSGDSLVIYAAAMAKTLYVPGMGDHIGASFANRAKAILKWFIQQADTIF